MKTLKLLFCSSLIVLSSSLAFGQSWLWGKDAKVYSGLMSGKHAAADNAGNCYYTGWASTAVTFGTFTLYGGSGFAFLVKYDSTGNVLWAQQGIANYSDALSVATDKKGNVFITGIYSGGVIFGSDTLRTLPSRTDIFLVKYDANGNEKWAKHSRHFYPPGDNGGNSVATDSKGNVYITGQFNDTVSFGPYTLTPDSLNSNLCHSFLVKYDSNGNVKWARQSHGSSWPSYGLSLHIDNMDNIYETGQFAGVITFGSYVISGPMYSEAYIAKYDTSGNVVWAIQTYNANDNGVSDFMASTTDKAGNIYVTGLSEDTVNYGNGVVLKNNFSANGMFLAKYNSAGKAVWAKSFETLDSNKWNGWGAITADTMNHIYLTDNSYQASNSGANFALKFGSDTFKLYSNQNAASVILKFDTAGNLKCGSIFPIANGSDAINYAAVDPSGKCVYVGANLLGEEIFGLDTLPGQSATAAFIARWQPCVGTVDGINELKPESEKLNVFPNPFPNSTTISVESGKYKVESYLELYDLTGRVVKQVEFTGTTYTLSAEGLAKGMYFIRIFDTALPQNGGGDVIGTSKIIVQ